MKLNQVKVDQSGEEGVVEVTTTDADGVVSTYRYTGNVEVGLNVRHNGYCRVEVGVWPRKRDSVEQNAPGHRFDG